MRIGLGSDHIGFECKERLKTRLIGRGHAVEDLSGNAPPGKYYGVTEQVASAIQGGRADRGVLICSSAIGASVLANKHRGVRAALCHDLYSAQHGVEDDDMNLLVMGACVVTHGLACKLTDVFIQASCAPREQVFGIPPRRLRYIVEHIRKNLDNPLAVSALSRMAEMSQSHFSKLFKLSTGLPPHQFVLLERIKRAKELLLEGNARIVDIALGVGFENQAHFTTVFGNLVGMTPRQVQRSSDWEAARVYHPPLSAAECR